MAELTDQEKALLEMLRQIKIEGEVKIALSDLLKTYGVKNYSSVCQVLYSQGFILNLAGKRSHKSLIKWNRAELPNIHMVKAIIEAARKRHNDNQNSSMDRKRQPVTKEDITKSLHTQSPLDDYNLLISLHLKAVEEFNIAKEKLFKINELLKLYK